MMKKNFLVKKPFLVICKLFLFELLNDVLALIFLIIFPIFISISWILFIEFDIIPEVSNTQRFAFPLTQWYDYTIFWLSLVSLVYLGLKFSQFCKTVLFRKIVVGQVSFAQIILTALFFFFIFSLIVFAIKFGLLMYYPSFRRELANADLFALIGGFVLLIITFLSLGLLFGSLFSSTTTLIFLSLFLTLCLLVLGGFFLNIEMLFYYGELDFGNRNQYYLWENISSTTNIYRKVTFISPFQPTLQIINASHANQGWKIPLPDADTNAIYYRPMVYSNYWSPFLIAFAWIFAINIGNYFLLKNKKY